MSRGVMLMLLAVALLVAAMFWLAGRAREVPTTRIEQTVPVNALPR